MNNWLKNIRRKAINPKDCVVAFVGGLAYAKAPAGKPAFAKVSGQEDFGAASIF